MHSYCNSCAFMHNFTPTNVGVFWSKCVKSLTFCILQDYATIDMGALIREKNYFIYACAIQYISIKVKVKK